MEIIGSDDRLGRLYEAGQRFIFNDFEGDRRAQSSRDFSKLYRALCKECDPRREKNAMTVHRPGQEICFETFREAVGWLMEHRPGNRSNCTI